MSNSSHLYMPFYVLLYNIQEKKTSKKRQVTCEYCQGAQDASSSPGRNNADCDRILSPTKMMSKEEYEHTTRVQQAWHHQQLDQC